MCCGQTPRTSPTLLAAAVPAGTRDDGQWRVTYPNGRERLFDAEWQAKASQAVAGGTVERVEQPAAEETTAAAEVDGGASTSTTEGDQVADAATRTLATSSTTTEQQSAPDKSAGKRPRGRTSTTRKRGPRKPPATS
jgi:hypothetical protein